MVIRKATVAASQDSLDKRHEHAKMEMHELHEHGRLGEGHDHVTAMHEYELHGASPAGSAEMHDQQSLEHVGREVRIIRVGVV